MLLSSSTKIDPIIFVNVLERRKFYWILNFGFNRISLQIKSSLKKRYRIDLYIFIFFNLILNLYKLNQKY